MRKLHLPAHIGDKISSMFGKIVYVTKKNFPKICVGAGMLTAGVAMYEACRATYDDLDDVLDSIDDQIAEVDEACERGMIDEKAADRKRLGIRVRGMFHMSGVYAKASLLFALAMFLFVAGHRCMARRYAALASAYSMLQTQAHKMQEQINEVCAKEGVDPPYATGIDGEANTIWFDENCLMFTDCPEMNYTNLMSLQSELNHMLRIKRIRTVNDIRDRLGLPRTKSGQAVGWVWDGKSDDQISLGLDLDIPAVHRFVNALTPAVPLTLNVEGPVWDELK